MLYESGPDDGLVLVLRGSDTPVYALPGGSTSVGLSLGLSAAYDQ